VHTPVPVAPDLLSKMPSTLGRRKKPAELPAPVSIALASQNDGLLPTNVLYEVLLRLPAKELCRLRLVCRSWRSLTLQGAPDQRLLHGPGWRIIRPRAHHVGVQRHNLGRRRRHRHTNKVASMAMPAGGTPLVF